MSLPDPKILAAAARAIRDADKYPLMMRIAMFLHDKGVTEQDWLSARSLHTAPQPAWYRVGNHLRDLERKQTSYSPKELQRLRGLSLGLSITATD